MYSIILSLEGSYNCEGRLQDSTERWTESTLSKAIKSLIKFARTGNRTEITKRDITFLREVTVTEQHVKRVPFSMPR